MPKQLVVTSCMPEGLWFTDAVLALGVIVNHSITVSSDSLSFPVVFFFILWSLDLFIYLNMKMNTKEMLLTFDFMKECEVEN